MTYYRQIRRGLNNYDLVPANEVLNHVKAGDVFTDYYTSVYLYTEDQFKTYLATGTIAGVDDVVTDKLVFDFDADDIEKSRQDAIQLGGRLEDAGISVDNIEVFFSGSKGVHIELLHDQLLTPTEHKAIAKQLANGLETFDPKVYDHARAFRAVGSVNKKSGLFKIPLTINELINLSIVDIKEKAKKSADWTPLNKVQKLPAKVLEFKKIKEDFKPKVKMLDVQGIDWSMKPKWLSNCKWSLQNGNFGAGERNNALMSLCATYKNQGFDKEANYRLLKSVTEKQSLRTGQERFSNQEIWNKVIKVVYEDTWKGGQYSCKEVGWLQDYCLGLGDKGCSHKVGDNLIATNQVFDLFRDYTDKYEKNVLFSGIPQLDLKMKFMVGTSNGILAPPGVGKTSLCLQILEHNSNTDVPCLFYSYDMFHSALYMRMFQRETGWNQDKIYSLFKENPQTVMQHVKKLNDKFKNVQFCFKAGQTINELEQTILEAEEKLGRKPKLIVVDYNELVMTDVSDPTSSSALVAQRLRQIANEQEVCIITLLQPAKQYCSPADEITNFNSVKGSSSIVQSLTLLLGCSRPGFNPLNPETDKFFNITCLKNRNGPLFTLDLSWEGLTGRIDGLHTDQSKELSDIRNRKQQEKLNNPFG